MPRLTVLGVPVPVTTAIPFNAGSFSAVGGTWTITAADVQTFEITRIDNFVHIDLVTTAGTIAGNPSELLVTIPVTVPATSVSFLVIDPLGNPTGGFTIININTNQLRLRPLSGTWGNGVTPLALEISFSL